HPIANTQAKRPPGPVMINLLPGRALSSSLASTEFRSVRELGHQRHRLAGAKQRKCLGGAAGLVSEFARIASGGARVITSFCSVRTLRVRPVAMNSPGRRRRELARESAECP